jgi:hypothetical protein
LVAKQRPIRSLSPENRFGASPTWSFYAATSRRSKATLIADCRAATQRPSGSDVMDVVRPMSTADDDAVAEIGAISAILRLLM